MFARGIATIPLDTGRCPLWLFERMVRLAREMIWIFRQEYGPNEFLRRISDPVWFQSLGTVLAFDWNSSGLTTILTAALKEAIRGREQELGIFICGGKGKTSRKTPDEIRQWGDMLSLPQPSTEMLVYRSKMAAKVDSALVQDGYQIYHHAFFFALSETKRSSADVGGRPTISWAVIQQGMNKETQSARRYHWYSEKVRDFIEEPHTGIVSKFCAPTLNLTARESVDNRDISVELVRSSYPSLMKDIQIVRRHFSQLSRMVTLKRKKEQFTFFRAEDREFFWHPVLKEDFSRSRYLEKILARVTERKPENYETFLAMEGVGPKTVRALSLVSEVIYGAEASYRDPARYSFAHGGKDATPYPVDRETYDETIAFFRNAVAKLRLPLSEKQKIIAQLSA